MKTMFESLTGVKPKPAPQENTAWWYATETADEAVEKAKVFWAEKGWAWNPKSEELAREVWAQERMLDGKTI